MAPASQVAASRVAVSSLVFSTQSSAGVARVAGVEMAVPKKRQSKMKTRQRKANWFAKAKRQAALALSRGKSAKYDPLADPKYALSAVDAEEEEDDDDEDDDE